jgi:hypothetical protein
MTGKPRFAVSGVCISVLLCAHLQAGAVAAEVSLPPVTVEETVPDPYHDYEAWERNVRDAIARAKLKPRAELTAHDEAQILIVESDMPVLQHALDTVEPLLRDDRANL